MIGTLNHSTCTVHFCYVTNKNIHAIAVVNVIFELCDLYDYFASLLLMEKHKTIKLRKKVVANSVVIVSLRENDIPYIVLKKVPD